jgi:lipoprotein-anchoring transpeptidase ErfK/SrfK
MNRTTLFATLAATLALAACSTVPQRTAAPQPFGWGFSDKAAQAMATNLGRTSLKPGEHVWRAEAKPAGPTDVVIDLSRQMAFVYRGGSLVAASTISSGKIGHDSPVGHFPILEKNRIHKSNRYSDAPMPFMQRLTWNGIALHGGALPGYPASHGCIRLPMKFAQKLFAATTVGSNVYIED